MKKFLLMCALVCAAVFSTAPAASAQSRFGVIGGMTFSRLDKQSLNRSNMTQYHAGVTYQLKLPLGFAIQPSLIYHVKGAKLAGVQAGDMKSNMDFSVGYLELPVSFQWGPDLLLFRPFLDVTPFIGYGLNNKVSVPAVESVGEPTKYTNSWKTAPMKRFEVGLGVGVGLEIWKFQLIGRYNWNFGSLYKLKQESGAKFSEIVKNGLNKNNFGGFTLSLAFLF